MGRSRDLADLINKKQHLTNATETVAGVAKLATIEKVITGQDGETIVTPKDLKSEMLHAMKYNESTKKIEVYDGSNWLSVTGSATLKKIVNGALSSTKPTSFSLSNSDMGRFHLVGLIRGTPSITDNDCLGFTAIGLDSKKHQLIISKTDSRERDSRERDTDNPNWQPTGSYFHLFNDLKLLESSTTVTGSGGFGYVVSMSADGNVVIIGDNSGNKAYVYRKTGSSWSLEKTVAGSGDFGGSVSISADGNSVIVGDYGGKKAEIFRKTGSSWSLEKTVTGSGDFGWSVSMSADGNSVIVGDYGGKKAYVYRKTGSSWSLEKTVTGSGNFGWSVSISADGNSVIVGDYGGKKAYVYRKTGSSWSLEKTVTGSGGFGVSVSISADGNSVIVGDHTGKKAEIFRKTGSSWSLDKRLTGSGYFGWSVSISADGNSVIVGDNSDKKAYVYRKTGSSWSLEKTVTGSGSFGRSVSISADGNSVIVGDQVGNKAEIYTFGSKTIVKDIKNEMAKLGATTPTCFFSKSNVCIATQTATKIFIVIKDIVSGASLLQTENSRFNLNDKFTEENFNALMSKHFIILPGSTPNTYIIMHADAKDHDFQIDYNGTGNFLKRPQGSSTWESLKGTATKNISIE